VTDVVWIVRHGERRDTVDETWAASAARPHDPPLTELGRWAAWRVGRRFVDASVDLGAVYASPFLRAVETADEICRETGDVVRLEPGLGEHRNADWFETDPETLAPETLAERFDTVRLDHDPRVEPTFPETWTEAAARIGETARLLVAERRGDGPLLLVGHGATVGGVVHGLVGPTAAVETPLCGLTRLVRDGDGWRVDVTGDTTHLRD
jgi:broad specificity phosphatase PhoE